MVGMVGEWGLLKNEKNQTANCKTKEAAFQWKNNYLLKHQKKGWNSFIKISKDKAFLVNQETQHGSGGQKIHQIREEPAGKNLT